MDRIIESTIGERVQSTTESRETKPQEKSFGWTKQDTAVSDDRSKVLSISNIQLCSKLTFSLHYFRHRDEFENGM